MSECTKGAAFWHLTHLEIVRESQEKLKLLLHPLNAVKH
jgi:hypothetical protein